MGLILAFSVCKSLVTASFVKKGLYSVLFLLYRSYCQACGNEKQCKYAWLFRSRQIKQGDLQTAMLHPLQFSLDRGMQIIPETQGE